jgi:hypothetical protein
MEVASRPARLDLELSVGRENARTQGGAELLLAERGDLDGLRRDHRGVARLAGDERALAARLFPATSERGRGQTAEHLALPQELADGHGLDHAHVRGEAAVDEVTRRSPTSCGSYSGGGPNETITRGKLHPDTPRFIIESDATIVAPLVFARVLDW